MGNLTIDKVYGRIMGLIMDIPQDVESMRGAVHTLKSMILKSTEGNEELARRLSAYIETSKNQTFGEKLLDFFATYAPKDLAAIGLNSTIFRDAMGHKMCETILNTNGGDQL